MMIGFQSSAFQASAFQSKVVLGFQANAFQNSGFQTGLYVVPAIAVGGGYEEKKKKRYVVRKDNRLLVFNSESEALLALKPPAIEVKQYPIKKAKAKVQAQPIVLPTPKPVEQIDLQAIVDLSTLYAAQQEYQFLLKAQEYEALLNLYKKFKQREEEEIIFLLMAA